MRIHLETLGCWLVSLRDKGLKPAPRPIGRALIVYLSVIVLPLTLLAPSLRAETDHDYQTKAQYLLRFARFTEWPPEAFADKDSPLLIGVLGADPFGSFLDETVRGESVRGRPIGVARYRRVQDIKTCHILYIGQSEAARLDQHLTALKGRAVLTVSDITNETARAVMISFVTQTNKVRFRINVETAKAAGLSLSSKLVHSAEAVRQNK